MTQNSVFAATYKVMKMFQQVRRQAETVCVRDELKKKLFKHLDTMFKSPHRVECDKLDDILRSHTERLVQSTNRLRSLVQDTRSHDVELMSETDKLVEVTNRLRSLMQSNVLDVVDIKRENAKLTEVTNRLKSLMLAKESESNTEVNNPKVDE